MKRGTDSFSRHFHGDEAFDGPDAALVDEHGHDTVVRNREEVADPKL